MQFNGTLILLYFIEMLPHMVSDMDSSTYISWNYLLVHFKVNKWNSTLQLLSTIQILQIFGSTHSFVDDIQPKLKLPKLIYDIIKEEEEYQIDIYFSNTL